MVAAAARAYYGGHYCRVWAVVEIAADLEAVDLVVVAEAEALAVLGEAALAEGALVGVGDKG